MYKIGAFTFVLHSHMPYVRLSEKWPHGEEWIHEAITETYIPLIGALNQLRKEDVRFQLTLGITPILAEQLADELVLTNFASYLQNKIAVSQQDYERFHNESKPELAQLAHWYHTRFSNVLRLFEHDLQRDIIGGFRSLEQSGHIEIITSAATHAYLPLLSSPASIHAQLQTGIQTHQRLFHTTPKTIWLPECGYRPGLEAYLHQYGLKLFFSETHALTGGEPIGIAAGDNFITPYNIINEKFNVPKSGSPARPMTTYLPYQVGASPIAVIGRNHQTGYQVWSNSWGYPGDYDYREFHKRDSVSGLQYWRITHNQSPLDKKEVYHPEWASYKVEQHAEHFTHMVGDLLRNFHDNAQEYGIIASNYDTELFGHWWLEGIDWIQMVLRYMSASPQIELMSAKNYLLHHPNEEAIQLPESSWGTGGLHFTWQNEQTQWVWETIHQAEQRLLTVIQNCPAPNADQTLVLNQALRELLLLQSSDWSFLITTGQAEAYATKRIQQHRDRFYRLLDSLEGSPDVALAIEAWEQDKVFPDIDFHWYVAG